jgi:hypothetical protein
VLVGRTRRPRRVGHEGRGTTTSPRRTGRRARWWGRTRRRRPGVQGGFPDRPERGSTRPRDAAAQGLAISPRRTGRRASRTSRSVAAQGLTTLPHKADFVPRTSRGAGGREQVGQLGGETRAGRAWGQERLCFRLRTAAPVRHCREPTSPRMVHWGPRTVEPPVRHCREPTSPRMAHWGPRTVEPPVRHCREPTSPRMAHWGPRTVEPRTAAPVRHLPGADGVQRCGGESRCCGFGNDPRRAGFGGKDTTTHTQTQRREGYTDHTTR